MSPLNLFFDNGLVLLNAITVTYAGPPDRPSDAWRLVDAGSPLPRVGRHRPAASVPATGSPAGAASSGQPGGPGVMWPPNTSSTFRP